MTSFKHDFLKNMLNAMSIPMYWKLPPVNHLRNILETSTMFSTLPWGVTFEKIDYDLFSAEWLVPREAVSDRVILYLHGGGYVIGSSHTHRALAGSIAKGVGASCLVIDYRKAPENPYPAALDDAFHAYNQLLDTGYKADHIAVVGDSAGGGLSIALQYELRDLGLPLPRCTVLLSPYLDLNGTGRSVSLNAKNDRFLDVFEMRRWAEMYAGDQDFKDPLISPLYGNTKGLPPILVQASESEVLYDDSVRFVKKARQSGVDIEFQTWHGLIHWWHMFGTMPEAKEAIGKVIEFINLRFAGIGNSTAEE
ncbi:MAG: alpha/beta hydrolase [Cyclobacteriaceae bacterium]|nr:alpha/beta hydrolase [Cyclobacteriaceae bacterium]